MQKRLYESGSCVQKNCAILGVHPKIWEQVGNKTRGVKASFWASTPTKAVESSSSWRKRVGVEPTIRPAKDRIAGFEGRGDHRTPFASVFASLSEHNHLLNPLSRERLRNGLRCYCGAIRRRDLGDRLVQVRDAEVRVALRHGEP